MEFEEKAMPLMGSGKAVKGQGAVKAQIKKTLVKGKGPMMGNLVKSGKTYAQAVSGGATIDSDGFELVKSKNKRVGDQSTTGGSAVSPLSTLGSLGIRMPEGLKSVEEVPEWEEIEMAVDSGASESVVSEDMLTRVTTVEGYA